MTLSTQDTDRATSSGPAEAPAGSGAERLLMDAVDRALRAPKGRLAMALHLSRLKHPQPRSYQTRVALALMMDTAQRLGGQVFPMRNTDLVLLCAAPEEEARPGRPSPAPLGLMQSLQRLFGFDAPEAVLSTIWRLDEQPGAFRDYISQRLAEPAVIERRAEEAVSSAGLPTLMARLGGIDLRQILMQQTAIMLQPGEGLPLAARFSPLYREVLFVPIRPHAASEAAPLADPFIHRHVATTLDARLLAHVTEDLRVGGTLSRPALLLGVPMHLNLSPEAIVSPGFARLAQMAQARGARFAIEMSAMDAVADPPLTLFARDLLSQLDFGLVLGGIDHAGLAMIDTAALAPALVKLAWSSRMADGPRALLAPLDTALAAIGPARVVLHEADGEAALLWAQARGITRFQGPYIDAVQAASRIAICHSARACTLRQCTGRAQMLAPGPRTACGNPGLLDMPSHTPPARRQAA